MISYIKYMRKSPKLYMYELFLTKETHFKTMRAPLGLERIIFTQLGVGRYKMVSKLISDPGVGVCLIS